MARRRTGMMARGGLMRTLVWPYLFKNYSVRDLAEFLEIYGLPLRLGKYPAGASDDEQRRLMWGLNQLGRHGYGVVPEGMSIELVTAVQSGAGDAFERLVAYSDKTISRAVLGSTLTTSADGGTKTNALGKVHADTRHNLTVDDAIGEHARKPGLDRGQRVRFALIQNEGVAHLRARERHGRVPHRRVRPRYHRHPHHPSLLQPL